MSMIPAPNCFGNCPNPQGIYVNSAVGGCPPTHPNSQRPNCPPPPPPMVTCQQCAGGYPVVNQFMTPNGSCPPGWLQMPNNGGPSNPCPLPSVSCDSCMGGSPVTNMFPIAPPGGAPCPTGWQPSVVGVNPCTPPPLPGITTTFIANIQDGLNRFGCSFLYKRFGHLQNKLSQLVSAGTNPKWRIMLQNRLNHIQSLIMSNCTGGPTPGPVKPMPNTPSGGNAVPNQQMMNASGGVRPYFPPLNDRQSGRTGRDYPYIEGTRTGSKQLTDEQAVRVAEVVGTWMN
jgi:hypothetical protein